MLHRNQLVAELLAKGPVARPAMAQVAARRRRMMASEAVGKVRPAPASIRTAQGNWRALAARLWCGFRASEVIKLASNLDGGSRSALIPWPRK